ncbi:MAG: hypothetical protein LBE25_13590 [Arthrobacter sp.]|jgi:hypothetical protein|nr:hypothetical protein [Arthrobacter sp.]
MTDQTPSTEDYFGAKTVTETHNGSPLTAFEMDAAKAIRDNPIFYAEYQDERGFMHLDQEDAEHCALKIGEILRERLAARDREVAAKALRDAAAELPEYDLPFMVNGRATIHVYHWLNDRATSIGAGDE